VKTLVLANQKGGVGKSALVTQLAHHLYRRGFGVLIIDLDHQQNATRPLRAHVDVTCASQSACHLMASAEAFVIPANRFVLIPGDQNLSLLERQPQHHNQFASRLRTTLTGVTGFDVCIIDTNPNPDIRYGAALICADFVLAPIQLNQEAIEGIAALLDHPKYGIARIKAVLNSRLEFLGVLPNLVEPTPFQRANLRSLITRFGPRLLSSGKGDETWFAHVPKRSAIAEAQAAGVFLPDLGKTAARDTWREVQPVFDLILQKIGLSQPAREAAL